MLTLNKYHKYRIIIYNSKYLIVKISPYFFLIIASTISNDVMFTLRYCIFGFFLRYCLNGSNSLFALFDRSLTYLLILFETSYPSISIFSALI